MRLWKKRDEVRALVLKHLASVRTAIEAFDASTRAFFVERDEKRAAELALTTHRAEGTADDIRREVEQRMISGALLPPTRRQILQIVERVDTLANAAEASIDRLLLEKIAVPEEIIPFVLEILEIARAMFENIECAVRLLFDGELKGTMECSDRIEAAEAKIDHIEAQARENLFSLHVELASKLHVSSYLAALVELSDRAEDLADSIALSAAMQAF